MDNISSLYLAFVGERRIASGTLQDLLPVLKQRVERGDEAPLCFDIQSGAQVDFDLRGSLADVLERYAPSVQRGRGRPKLGVEGKEISLFPRHWAWLEQQPNGASAAIRRLVEQASKHEPGREIARRIRAALSRILSAMAGNRENYEEACRALFAGDDQRFELLVSAWPADIRDFAVHQVKEAARAEREHGRDASEYTLIIKDLYQSIWSYGDYGAIGRLVAPAYTIHADPGDAWEGKTLDHEEYKQRVRYSRQAFPDLSFALDDILACGDRVSVRWHAEGTHAGDLKGLPATGKRLSFAGQTIYELERGLVRGHWQVVDRLGFFEQIRMTARV